MTRELPDEGEAPELSIELVCALARLVRTVQGKTASTAPAGLDDQDDPEAEILEDRGMDASEAELRHLIRDLDETAQAELVALMWLGRGDEQWPVLRDLATQEHTAFTADYLLGTPPVADHLLAGLDRLGLACPPGSW